MTLNPSMIHLNDILESDEVVVQVRRWGTNEAIPLVGTQPLPLGPGVRLEPEGERWWVRTEPAYAVHEDGVPRREFLLRPATEIGVGPTLHLAESQRIIVLRNLCRRLLGWSSEQLPKADRAVRKIWLCVTRRTPIVIRGGGEPVSVARLIHRVVRGHSAPFALCSRRGQAFELDGLPAQSLSAQDTLRAASGGSLCFRVGDKPNDFDKLTQALLQPDCPTLTFLCTAPRPRTYENPSELCVPLLLRRSAELPRVVDEFAQDAIGTLKAPAACFGERERDFVLRVTSASFSAIERDVHRVIELRRSADIRSAARRLGVAGDYLVQWMREFE